MSILRSVAVDTPSVLDRAQQLAETLAQTAVERDRQGGHAALERQLIRDSGLLSLSIPKRFGGPGTRWTEILHTVAILAEADSALAHIYAFHHMQHASVQFWGTEAQQQRLLGESLRLNQFWGNTLNPLDHRAIVTEQADGSYLLSGDKAFCSGALGSDRLIISGWHEPTQSLLVANVPTSREGILIRDDWDGIGQRQTDSGTAQFHNLRIEADEVLTPLGYVHAPFATLRTCMVQLVMAILFASLGRAALNTSKEFLQQQAKPWFASGVPSAVDDPYIQQRFAKLWLRLKPAQLLIDEAIAQFEAAFAKGSALSAEERGAVAIAAAEAKVLAHQAGLEASSQMFDLMGARAAQAQFGFDRFWRNARTHTLHDPVDYKVRDIGRWLLSGVVPTPTAYS